MHLPELFLLDMKTTFAENQMDDFDAFVASFDCAWQRAWRLQSKSISAEEVARRLASDLLADSSQYEVFLHPVPWAKDGYYIPDQLRPALSTIHQLGLIYIQEASAMLPASVLDVQPDENVIDLCAAPGGKSLQIAKALDGTGYLLANDISSSRARVLQRNLEQCGTRNTFVSAIDPSKGLHASWFETFDKVQVDAPCSGEGMFRRDSKAISSWEAFGPQSIQQTQLDILESALQLCKVGGKIVYSTCTFNRMENEYTISRFLAKHENVRVIEVPVHIRNSVGIRTGLNGEGIHEDLQKAVRIWPQDAYGDGHFCVLLEKTSASVFNEHLFPKVKKSKSKDRKTSAKVKQSEFPSLTEAKEAYEHFIEETIRPEYKSYYLNKIFRLHQNWVYISDNSPGGIEETHMLKTGTFVGELKKSKTGYVLIASHAFLLAQAGFVYKSTVHLEYDDERIAKIFKAETIHLSREEQEVLDTAQQGSYIVFLWNDIPIAWGKKIASTVKNLYPANWVR